MDAKRLKRWNARVIPVLIVAFLLTLIAEPAYARIVQITVRLNGGQEVPPVVTTGKAVGRITVNTITRAISGTVTFTGLPTPSTAGHIHMAAARVNGPIVIPLVGGVGVTAGRMRVPPATVLLPAQLTALRANGLYVNIHTSTHPGGEIRGQIRFPKPVPVASANQVPMLKVVSWDFNPVQTGG